MNRLLQKTRQKLLCAECPAGSCGHSGLGYYVCFSIERTNHFIFILEAVELIVQIELLVLD